MKMHKHNNFRQIEISFRSTEINDSKISFEANYILRFTRC